MISSHKNPLVRNILKLDKARERKNTGLFKVEGLRECKLALDSGYALDTLLFSSKYISEEDIRKRYRLRVFTKLIDVQDHVFNELVYRKGIENCLGIFEYKQLDLKDLELKSNALILITVGLEKPGNLGAILRTADAAGVDLVVVCDAQTDIFNPNCIRSSLGAVFSLKVVSTDSSSCIKWLKENSIKTFITHLEASENYLKMDYTNSTAIVMGSEAYGVNDEWSNSGFQNIIIPQFGKVDSMNVSNSAAIVIYEAIRQRTMGQ